MNHKTLLSIKLSIMAAASAALCSSCVNNAGTADPTPLNTSGTAGDHPVAKPMIDPKTGQPVKDHYVSPFHPYNPIVAKYFKSGQLAGDPSTAKVDPKTGKPDNSTLKVFRIP